MNNKEIEYHSIRTAFIIFPDTGILFARPKTAMSHKDMLESLGYKKDRIQYIIDNFPRGYYMDNNLVFYQGS